MTKQTPAYGVRAAKGPVARMSIERRDPGPHDVAIEILYCGICHSDVHKVNDDWGTTHFPVVPGHEIVGRVVSQGTSASRFREGDLTGVGCIVDSCRVCPECRAGHEMFCEKGVTFTFDSPEPDGKTWTYGGYSTNMVVDERYVLRIPKGLDPGASRTAPLRGHHHVFASPAIRVQARRPCSSRGPGWPGPHGGEIRGFHGCRGHGAQRIAR